MGNAEEIVPEFNNRGAVFLDVSVSPGFGSQIPHIPKKSTLTTYLLALPPLGLFGGHHFYLGRHEFGVLYFFTIGLLGVGWVLDLFRIPLMVRSANKVRFDINPPKQKSSLDAYLLWGSPAGLLGFHHYYLGRWTWGLAYTFTLGLAGIGWICDAFRMGSMVRETNDRKLRRFRPTQDPNELEEEERMTLPDAYVLAISPFGLFGAHHYYMGRFFIGIVYTFSAGLLGIGWVVDWLNMPVLFRRAKRIKLHGDDSVCYLDDAYRLLWPFGFLGLHHFYLRRPGYGVLYILTLGLLTVGWIYDFFRLPRLVKEANKKAREERAHLEEIRDRLGPNARIVGDQRAYVAYATRDADGGVVLQTQAVPINHVTSNSICQLPPPPYPGSSVAVNRNVPATYRSAGMMTITEDDENSINEATSQLGSSENITHRNTKD